MLSVVSVRISDIYVPISRRKTLDPRKVQDLAEDILINGQKTPIRLRRDGDRFVLLEGLHRLHALSALGEESIDGFVVKGRLH